MAKGVRDSDQELFGNLCSRYRLRWESYSRLVCDSAREAVDVRNTYLGHDNLSVFQKMTPELLADALTKLIAPAEVLADAGNAEIEKMRARRDRAVAALRCQPLTLKEMEQAVPDFDIFMLNNSQLKPDFDVGAGILYLHSLQEVCDVLGAIRRQIASGIDLLVHLGRMRDKTRKVLEIAEILGFENGEIITRTLYAFEENDQSTREKVCGELVKKGELTHVGKLEEAGMGTERRENRV